MIEELEDEALVAVLDRARAAPAKAAPLVLRWTGESWVCPRCGSGESLQYWESIHCWRAVNDDGGSNEKVLSIDSSFDWGDGDADPGLVCAVCEVDGVYAVTEVALPEREVVVVSWDALSNPVLRFRDELGLAEHLRTRPEPGRTSVEIEWT